VFRTETFKASFDFLQCHLPGGRDVHSGPWGRHTPGFRVVAHYPGLPQRRSGAALEKRHMATALSILPLPSFLRDCATVRIFNPVSGGATRTSVRRALKFVKAGRAYFDGRGHLVFVHHRSQHGPQLLVSNFSGCDALPERAVMPPSPEVLSRMGTTRSRVGGPVRPPLRARV